MNKRSFQNIAYSLGEYGLSVTPCVSGTRSASRASIAKFFFSILGILGLLFIFSGCSHRAVSVIPEAISVIPENDNFKTDIVSERQAQTSERQARAKEKLEGKQQQEEDERPIRMLFFGDMMLGRYVRTIMDRQGADTIFSKIREGNTYFDGYYDLVIANLEGPIVTNPVYRSTGTTFGFTPDTAEIIKRNKIQIVGIANNHTLDRGEKGLQETKIFLKKTGVEFFGHPIFPSQEDILIKKIRDKKFAFIGFHDATRRLNEDQAKSLVAEYNNKEDVVIIFIHWGTEYVKTPNERQKKLARLFIDSGADLIIGHHPHWIQTRENYKGVEIFYSLGNFIFDQYWSDPTQHGLAVGVEWPAKKNESPVFEEMPFSLYKSIPTWDKK